MNHGQDDCRAGSRQWHLEPLLMWSASINEECIMRSGWLFHIRAIWMLKRDYHTVAANWSMPQFPLPDQEMKFGMCTAGWEKKNVIQTTECCTLTGLYWPSPLLGWMIVTWWFDPCTDLEVFPRSLSSTALVPDPLWSPCIDIFVFGVAVF